jgi:hypothetical protein
VNTGNERRRVRVVLHGVTLLFLLSIIASCDNGTNTTAPITTTTTENTGEKGTEAFALQIHWGVGAQLQNIWIFQGGWAITDGVSDAVATVNGVAIPHAGLYPGYYKGHLPAAVPPGSSLELRVSARGIIVEATGSVGDRITITR